jgi:hypothetical protein
MSALLALIPSKDWIYGAIIAGLIAFGFYEVHHLKAEGAASEVTALKVSSDKLIAQETAHVALVAKTYAAAAAATQETLDEQVQTAARAQVSDSERLREYSAYRSTHPDVASAAGAGGNTVTGSPSAGQGEDFVSELGSAGVSLADALRGTSAALTACMSDRDSLTGKP